MRSDIYHKLAEARMSPFFVNSVTVLAILKTLVVRKLLMVFVLVNRCIWIVVVSATSKIQAQM